MIEKKSFTKGERFVEDKMKYLKDKIIQAFYDRLELIENEFVALSSVLEKCPTVFTPICFIYLILFLLTVSLSFPLVVLGKILGDQLYNVWSYLEMKRRNR